MSSYDNRPSLIYQQRSRLARTILTTASGCCLSTHLSYKRA